MTDNPPLEEALRQYTLTVWCCPWCHHTATDLPAMVRHLDGNHRPEMNDAELRSLDDWKERNR